MQAKANTVTSSAKLYGPCTIRVFRPERASCNSSKKRRPNGGSLGNETGGIPFFFFFDCGRAGVATLQICWAGLGCRCGRPGDSFLTLTVQAHQWATFPVDSSLVRPKSHVAKRKSSRHDVYNIYPMYGRRPWWKGGGRATVR